MRALRRTDVGTANQFPDDVLELLGYFSNDDHQLVCAIPGAGQSIPVWILGSSTFGAKLAAELGLPYAFASHFDPRLLKEAITLYRTHFKPSRQLSKPYIMAGINVFAADTRADAEFIASG